MVAHLSEVLEQLAYSSLLSSSLLLNHMTCQKPNFPVSDGNRRNALMSWGVLGKEVIRADVSVRSVEFPLHFVFSTFAGMFVVPFPSCNARSTSWMEWDVR